MPQLIEPTEKYLNAYLDGCRETWGHTYHDYIIHDPAKFSLWKDTIFQDYRNQEAGIDLPPGHVPSKTFWIMEDGRYLGTANIRLQMTAKLADFGGNLGIILRPSARHQGLGCRMLQELVVITWEITRCPVFLSCEKENAASLKMLQNLRDSGIFELTSEESHQTFANGRAFETINFIYESPEMRNRQEIIRRISCLAASCAAARNGKIIAQKNGNGIRPLLEMAQENDLSEAQIADRIIGRAAAFIAIHAGAAAVYGDTMSDGAIALLKNAGIKYEFRQHCQIIINRAGTGPCPMEIAVDGITSPFEAVEKIKTACQAAKI